MGRQLDPQPGRSRPVLPRYLMLSCGQHCKLKRKLRVGFCQRKMRQFLSTTGQLEPRTCSRTHTQSCKGRAGRKTKPKTHIAKVSHHDEPLQNCSFSHTQLKAESGMLGWSNIKRYFTSLNKATSQQKERNSLTYIYPFRSLNTMTFCLLCI